MGGCGRASRWLRGVMGSAAKGDRPMRKLLACTAAVVMAIALGACASGPGSAMMPCEKCSYRYATVGKQSDRQVFCKVGDKEIDCKKNPGDCPGCKQ